MDRRTTVKERQARVVELLNTLGLTKVQNTLIGTPGKEKSLSGGERKRLAFATEVIHQVPLLVFYHAYNLRNLSCLTFALYSLVFFMFSCGRFLGFVNLFLVF